MANIEVFLEQVGATEFILFLIAQVCMIAAAGIAGYMLGRQKHWKEIGSIEAADLERIYRADQASGQLQVGRDGAEGREGSPPGQDRGTVGHPPRHSEPDRADQTGRGEDPPARGNERGQVA